MIEGLYKVSFGTPLGAGSGVVTLKEGRLTGGDSAMFYVGNYSHEGDRFIANVTVDRHTVDESFENVFGRDRVRVDIDGVVRGDAVDGRGQSPDAAGVALTVILTRLA